ncbi:MAG: hypothetical protein ABIF09_11375 [Gemmatimonadota bacterium]
MNRLLTLTPLLMLLLFPEDAPAQTTPGSDIWAFRVAGTTPTVDLASAVRVTQRTGYDNQPHFAPGERLILYTAIDSVGQADIWSYNLDTGERKNVTRSEPESEYSATVMPSLFRFSAIRVEADSTQRLWSFESGGTNPELVLNDIQPVGYHAWLDDDRLALFVLGSPATLQIASVAEGTAEVVAENIGRSVHRVPGRKSVSFVQWVEGGAGWISEYDPETGETLRLAPLLDGNEFYAWTPERVLFMGQGSSLFQWIPDESETWEEIADLEPAGILVISRISLSSEGGWLAVVGADEG